jgi:hypothetical protein
MINRSAEQAVLLRTETGCCWLQVRDVQGLLRLSHLGNLGDPEMVSDWCADRGIEFCQMHDAAPVPRRPALVGRV